MITQIEIDGFKTFKDFKVELAPFQVIVGANGSGKSNLLDALHLLSRLAEVDIRSAFQELRGDAHELFTFLPNGQRAKRMRIAVELLVNRNIQDSLGGKAELAYTRLRYEIEITQYTDEHDLEQLYVSHESLKSIPVYEDFWSRKHNVSTQVALLPDSSSKAAIFISTEMTTTAVMESSHDTPNIEYQEEMIHLSREGQQTKRLFSAKRYQSTALSAAINTDFPHSFAVHQEILSWRFINLDPKELRKPSSVNAPTFLTRDGGNLPAMLARMQAEDSFALTGVSLDMANLVPGILTIKVEKNPAQGEYDIFAETDDEISFSTNVLSDGTLRLLALATLRNDAQFHGVLCLEEPENGVNPSSMKEVAHLLKGLATDFSDPAQVGELLNQVIVTTHSSTFISQPDARDSLLFTYMAWHVEPLATGNPSLHITCMTPVITSNAETPLEVNANRDETTEIYTIDQVKKYLNSETMNEARHRLEKARTALHEGVEFTRKS